MTSMALRHDRPVLKKRINDIPQKLFLKKPAPIVDAALRARLPDDLSHFLHLRQHEGVMTCETSVIVDPVSRLCQPNTALNHQTSSVKSGTSKVRGLAGHIKIYERVGLNPQSLHDTHVSQQIQ